MNALSLRKFAVLAIAPAALAWLAAGCGSTATDSKAHRTSHDGLSFTIPAGWHQVPVVRLPGADVVVNVASFSARGGMHTICDPRAITRQIPAGGAVLQILGDTTLEHRASPMGDGRQGEPAERRFSLGSARPYECGEAFNSVFRKAGRTLQVRAWTTDAGPSPTVRRQIERLVNSIGVSQPAATVPPIRDGKIGFAGLREAVLRGVAADFNQGTGAGPPRFEPCLQSRLRTALSNGELASLVAVYRRPGGQQFAAQALSRLAVPLGDRCGGRRFVPEMIAASEALGRGHLAGHADGRLAVTYGPYVAVRCRQASSIRCDTVGVDIVLKRPAAGVSALIAGRPVALATPGMHSGAVRKDWVGSLAKAGLMRKGSPLYVRTIGRDTQRWAGSPPVYIRVRITATYANGSSRSTTFPHVFLSPGWG